MTTIKTFLKELPPLTLFLGLMVLVSLVTIAYSPFRKRVQNIIRSKSEIILASAESRIFSSRDSYKIVKVRRSDAIDIEIFKKNRKGAFERFQLIHIPNARDAYFEFGSQTLNLAMQDMDNDGVSEILVPLFVENNKSFLAIYKYNIIANKFELSNK